MDEHRSIQPNDRPFMKSASVRSMAPAELPRLAYIRVLGEDI